MAVNIGEPRFKVGDIVSRTTNYLPEFMGRVAGVETVYGSVSGVERVYKVEDIRAIERRAAAAAAAEARGADDADEADDAPTRRSKPGWSERIRSSLRKAFGDDAERALELSSGPALMSISESQLKLYAKFIPPLFKVGDVVKNVYNGYVGRVAKVVIQTHGGEPYYTLRDTDADPSEPAVGFARQDQLRKHTSGGGYKKRSKSSKSKTKKRRRKGRKTRRHRRKHKQKNA